MSRGYLSERAARRVMEVMNYPVISDQQVANDPSSASAKEYRDKRWERIADIIEEEYSILVLNLNVAHKALKSIDEPCHYCGCHFVAQRAIKEISNKWDGVGIIEKPKTSEKPKPVRILDL